MAGFNVMCEWVQINLGSEVPIHFSAFHPDYKMLDKELTPFTTIQRACGIARKNSLLYVYAGNVHDPDNDSTYCPECGELLVSRDWYKLSDWNLKYGRCTKCNTLSAGVFEDITGYWGRRRQSVNISAF